WPAEVRQVPPFMHEYYTDVIDILGDRHYGFLVVYVLLGRSDEEHQMVRLDLTMS
ncbi:hypothetical protein A2U01_0066934, partial [Trifolium medium]|nr:hypothetical protein [Trifolium medium]